jgi:pimeloyl-ACP methyl ester carboxylesterase
LDRTCPARAFGAGRWLGCDRRELSGRCYGKGSADLSTAGPAGRRGRLPAASYLPGQGSPTVLLEAGNGASSLDWFAVQPEVARTTRVCAYDRAGSGWSERGTGDRSGPTLVRELHTLLTNASIAPPYVLVGHSYGGLYARLYAARYPDEVVGMVLVDATHPDTWTWGPEAQRLYERQRQLFSFYPVLARLGLLRLQMRALTPPTDYAFTLEQFALYQAMRSTNRYADAAIAEYNDSLAVMALVRATGNLGNRPLSVVTAEGDHTFGRAETDEPERRHLAM